jgi:glutamine synthetase
MISPVSNTILEYIWLGGKSEIRSKTKVIPYFLPGNLSDIPEWNYDGSSTWQADSNGDTEIILKPCAIFKDPFRVIEDADCYLVLCETFKPTGEQTETNHRHYAARFFENTEEEPWFGLEQEFFFRYYKNEPTNENNEIIPRGYHYCGLTQKHDERIIMEQLLQMCIEIGIKISGINAEVEKNQWEFQIGPSEGIDAGDHMIVARYILERLAERIEATIDYQPKPVSNRNGSGCHINFSTYNTRSEDGIEFIYQYIEKLEKKHKQHIEVYGENNHLRLTGYHETSSIDKFGWGIGTRNTSIRIPNQVFQDKCGYFEDRRPAANIDPYQATFKLFQTCCLDEINV